MNFGEATSALSNLISLSIFVGVVASSPCGCGRRGASSSRG